MNFIDQVTGNDITRQMKNFNDRASKLTEDYQQVWQEIQQELMNYTDLTGRNLLPVYDNILSMLEEHSFNKVKITEVFNQDIKEFCQAVAKEEDLSSFKDKQRNKLNKTIQKKLNK
ncbi:MAG: DUF1048 domain-containing protein [Mycoplasmatales bacterium]